MSKMPKASEYLRLMIRSELSLTKQANRHTARATRIPSMPCLLLYVSFLSSSNWTKLIRTGKKDFGVPKFQAAKGTGKQAMPYGKSKVSLSSFVAPPAHN